MFPQLQKRWETILIFILLVNLRDSHGQLAQWLSPYLPPSPSESLQDDIATGELQYRQQEVLNETTGTVLEWSVVPRRNSSLSSSVITFNLTTRLASSSSGDANKYVLGLSRKGNLEGADVVLVRELERNGQAKLLDMYGKDNSTLVLDTRQNWRLNQIIWRGIEDDDANSVSLIISRELETCDEDQDIPINNDMLQVIWGSGENVVLDGSFSPIQFSPDGNVRVYLADPVVPNVNIVDTHQSLGTWRLSRRFRIPPKVTTYWCTIHRGLTLEKRHHVMKHAPYFENSISEKHVHHQIVFRCIAPPGIDPSSIFERFVGHPGDECYLVDKHQLPSHFCSEILMFWGYGGKPFIYPKDVGMSIGETQNEYFMFETHYDNPEMRTDLVVENGVDFVFSPEIRPNEGSIMYTGAGVLGLFMAPPNSPDFLVSGHCSAQCTTEMLTGVGGGGMDIVAVMLHGHAAVSKTRLRHFRGRQELLWILVNENFDFTYQQIRHLPQRVKIAPGDQLGIECSVDTRARNGTIVSGFASHDEMCAAVVLVNKRMGYPCTSEYPTETTLRRYGIQNVTWDAQSQERVVNQANEPNFVGRTLKSVIDSQNPEGWTEERKRELQDEQIYGEHNTVCPAARRTILLIQGGNSIDDVTGGALGFRERVDDGRPSIRTMDMPVPVVRKTRYPRPLVEYQPQAKCVSS